jgi:hypothetical protein
MQQMVFGQLEYGLLTEGHFLKMASLWKSERALRHFDGYEEEIRAVHTALGLCITLQVLQQTALYQYTNECRGMWLRSG